jgi:ribA/ribD-fused uncharacterized protein
MVGLMSEIVIDNFIGRYRFLSNFHSSSFLYDNRLFPTVEHAFQAYKASDKADFNRIALAETPGKSKRLGRSITLRKDWEEIKDSIMEELVRAKFTCNPVLKDKLIKTGVSELIEGNTWNDMYWGVCRGKGENKLGLILMKVRKEFQDEVPS